MPSGKTHDRLTWLALVPAAYLAHRVGCEPREIAVLGAGLLFGGLMFGPDLDINSRPYRRWGPLRWIWLPYRAFGHRSPWTHGLVRGPLVRLLYLSVALAGLYTLGRLGLAHHGIQLPDPRELEAALHVIPARTWELALGGMWLGAALHTMADTAVSAWRRR